MSATVADTGSAQTSGAVPAQTPVTSATGASDAGSRQSDVGRTVGPQAPAGRWVTSWFNVGLGGNPRLNRMTYATASIVDETGAARTPGGHLYIRNESDKYPLYYGLYDAPKQKLEPGQEVTLSLSSRRSANAPITNQTVTLRWFDARADESTGGRARQRN
jgi:hypothetical protein